MIDPFYEDADTVIYCADNADVVPHLSGVSLALFSPPYNTGDSTNRTGTKFKQLADGYDEFDDDLDPAVYRQQQKFLIYQCWKTLTETGAIFYNHKPRVVGDRVRLPTDLVPSDLPLRQVVIWDKGDGHNHSTTYYTPTHEYILVIAKPGWRTNTMSVDDVWRIPHERGTIRPDHPAPMPIRVARRAVETASKPGDLILDPYMGSGTTLRAAKDLGRRAIGIEISERYCAMAVDRLRQGVLL